MRRNPCRNRLRPYFVSSPLNNLSGCTENAKGSCRSLHPRQAAEVPHPAFAAGCAPASLFRKRRGKYIHEGIRKGKHHTCTRIQACYSTLISCHNSNIETKMSLAWNGDNKKRWNG